MPESGAFFVHPTSVVDDGAGIGDGTSIWHFSHVMSGARIGRNCSVGQNVFVADGVTIGDNVKIQNNVSVYSGVEMEDYVFCGPSCVFTNVRNPRCEFPRERPYAQTLIRRGATLGANCTIVCETTVGRYALVAAGAVVTKDVHDYALMIGNPARTVGWVGRHGFRLESRGQRRWICPRSEWVYLEEGGRLHCLTLPEDEPVGSL